jgi:hypothetical protein
MPVLLFYALAAVVVLLAIPLAAVLVAGTLAVAVVLALIGWVGKLMSAQKPRRRDDLIIETEYSVIPEPSPAPARRRPTDRD